MQPLPPVPIVGNTYPVRHSLAMLGGRWDSAQRAWFVPAEKADAARALVAGATDAKPQAQYQPSRCRTCGCKPSRYNPVYRSGVCRSCWQNDQEEQQMGY